MKIALASLLAVTSAASLDFDGCPKGTWGDLKSLKAESDCLFNKNSYTPYKQPEPMIAAYPMYLDFIKYCNAVHPKNVNCVDFAGIEIKKASYFNKDFDLKFQEKEFF